MIYLNAEVISGLGEDTFWTWMKRELGDKANYGLPGVANKDDIILQYSTKGGNEFPNNTVALLWELHPEMKVVLGGNDYDYVISNIENCARQSIKKTVTSNLMVKYYDKFGHIDVLPIGIDTDLFCPVSDKTAMRLKYGIPLNKKVGFWSGTTHPMKGFQKLLQYKNNNPDIHWIVAWKQQGQNGHLEGHSNYTHVNQSVLAELMGCADFFLSCSLLQPFFMVEWEAMSCNLPMVILDGMQKDFVPSSNPRDDIFNLGWDRKTAINTWKKYLNI
jgi:glycosyltransferase involved in cell wall biosynthesis